MTWLTNTVPAVLQSETNECGLACICMTMNYHGHHIDLPALRQQWPGDKPLSLEQLTKIASSYSLQARALRCEADDLALLNLPAIVHVDFDHFVVLEKISRNAVSIIDPATGRQQVSHCAFSRRFTGVVLELHKAPGFRACGKPKTTRPCPS